MNPNYRYDIVQNTEEWEALKIGMFSASSADKLLSDKNTKGYQQLINKIAEERITGNKCESKEFSGNSFTNRGHEYEPIASDDYEFRNIVSLKSVGVVIKNEWALCSPDRLIYDKGLLQIKCPIFSTQEEYLTKAKKSDDPKKIIPGNYYKQMQFELFVCSDREYNVFNSYHPNLRALDIPIDRDSEVQELIELRLNEAIEEVKSKIDIILSL